MEKLLHYVWKHRILPLGDLSTTDGRRVEVIDPGTHNSDRGPDFFNAKVLIDGMLWAGNVEIHPTRRRCDVPTSRDLHLCGALRHDDGISR